MEIYKQVLNVCDKLEELFEYKETEEEFIEKIKKFELSVDEQIVFCFIILFIRVCFIEYHIPRKNFNENFLQEMEIDKKYIEIIQKFKYASAHGNIKIIMDNEATIYSLSSRNSNKTIDIKSHELSYNIENLFANNQQKIEKNYYGIITSFGYVLGDKIYLFENENIFKKKDVKKYNNKFINFFNDVQKILDPKIVEEMIEENKNILKYEVKNIEDELKKIVDIFKKHSIVQKNAIVYVKMLIYTIKSKYDMQQEFNNFLSFISYILIYCSANSMMKSKNQFVYLNEFFIMNEVIKTIKSENDYYSLFVFKYFVGIIKLYAILILLKEEKLQDINEDIRNIRHSMSHSNFKLEITDDIYYKIYEKKDGKILYSLSYSDVDKITKFLYENYC